MAYINITTKYPVYNGMPLTFVAPCNCNEADGLAVNAENYVFKDAHGNTLTGIGNIFNEGAYVKVILDATNKYAYIQNGDSNAYLNAELTDKAPAYTYGTEELEPGVSPLATGRLHFVYE